MPKAVAMTAAKTPAQRNASHELTPSFTISSAEVYAPMVTMPPWASDI